MSHDEPRLYVTTADPLEAALAFCENGFNTMPLMPPGTGKGRKDGKWPAPSKVRQDRLRDAAAVEKEHRAARQRIKRAKVKAEPGIGLFIGRNGLMGHPTVSDPHARLLDLDLDCSIAAKLADRLPPTGFCFGRPGSPDSHRLYIATGCDSVKASGKFSLTETLRKLERHGGDRADLVDIRGFKGEVFTRVPPSMHGNVDGSKEPLCWSEGADGEAAVVDAVKLWEAARRVAVATLLAAVWPDPSQRHEFRYLVAGVLLRADWARDDAAAVITAAAAAIGDGDAADIAGCINSTAKRLADREDVAGRPKLARLLGELHGDEPAGAAELLDTWVGRRVNVADEPPSSHVSEESKDREEREDWNDRDYRDREELTISVPTGVRPPSEDGDDPRMLAMIEATEARRETGGEVGDHIAACLARALAKPDHPPAANVRKHPQRDPDWLFDFGHYLRAHPQVRHATPGSVALAVGRLFSSWGWGSDGWRRAFGDACEEPADLAEKFAKVDSWAGRESPVDVAVPLAERWPLVVPADDDDLLMLMPAGGDLHRVASLLAWMQHEAGNTDIFLPVNTLAACFGWHTEKPNRKLRAVLQNSLGLGKLIRPHTANEARRVLFLRMDLLPAVGDDAGTGRAVDRLREPA